MTTRVLYAPRNISGQATEYVRAVRPFGFAGEVWSYGDPAFGFPVDREIDPERLLTDPAHRWEVFDEAVRRFDVFHLQYSRSLLNPEGLVLPELWDVPLLRSLGKRVFMHFRGSDVRLRSLHLELEPDSYFKHADLDPDEPRIRGRVAICRRFCDAMFVSTPGLLDHVPDAIWIPHTIDVTEWERPPRAVASPPVVAHIPSSRATKGSEVIEPALRTLHDAGIIEFRSLSGLSRDRLREEIQAADLLVDSLTIGDHGLISVEAMAAGVVPIAHVRPESRERNPGNPVVEATVHDVGDVVRELATDPARIARLSRECIDFARERHDLRVVGAMLADAYLQPPRPVTRSHPDWPRSETRRRVEELEMTVDELTADVDPIVRGLGPSTRTLPAHALERLLGRVAELESALRELGGDDHPALREHGRRAVGSPTRSVRDLLKQHPRVHRLARRVALQLRRVGR